MTSAERVAEYGQLRTEEEEHEAHATALARGDPSLDMAIEAGHGAQAAVASGPLVDPGNSWPSCGDVAFEGVQLRYARHLPWALHGVNLHARAGEKIGEYTAAVGPRAASLRSGA